MFLRNNGQTKEKERGSGTVSNLDRMNAEQYLFQRSRKRIWQKIIIVLACVVVFCTTYALILPALTQERPVFCGMEEHTHADACVAAHAEKQQICEPEVHIHTEACRNEAGELVCGLADYLVHTHSDLCYREDRTLACTLDEHTCHVHTDACWDTIETVIPQVLHHHTESCVQMERGMLQCDLDEGDSHTHEDSCYEQIPVYICGLEEGAVQTEETVKEEKVLACTVPEAQEHVHTESCFRMTEGVPACEKEEHTHTLACYSNPSADVESRETWEQSFNTVERSGVWAEDVIAIAKTQLGYQESTENYVVLEDGITVKGYTRYGAWYGDPYGDWCAMFASFCLHYGDVQDMPLDANCPNWVAQLQRAGLYQSQGDYVPKTGDLIFFDGDGNGSPDHVGLVETVGSGENDILQITVLEGNSENRVQTKIYTMQDSSIFGYGTLPVQLTQEEQLQVEEMEARIAELPSFEEINAGIEQTENGESTWLEEAFQQVAQVYAAWNQLSEDQKQKVSNREILLMFEELWSSETLLETNTIRSDKPTKAKYTSTKDFIDLNLYDYNSKINEKWINDTNYPGFQWNGGAYKYKWTTQSGAGEGISGLVLDRHEVDCIDFGNSKITDYDYSGSDYTKSTTAVIAGILYNNGSQDKTGPINWLWWNNTNASITNRPVGYSTTDGALSRVLVDGFPALKTGESLSYLFTAGEAVTQMNTATIDGLFQQDAETGAYSYNSRKNHAQYTDNFFQLYDQILTPNFILYPFGNFLPMNSIDDSNVATQVGALNCRGGMKAYVEEIINSKLGSDATDTQLKAMLQEYRESWTLSPMDGTSWDTLSASQAISDFFTKSGPTDEIGFLTDDHLNNLYNIDWNVDTNFFFGMDMSMTFMQPRGGMTGKNDEHPMKFSFTGDDDVWVYIDDVLFLDLTGIHRHVGGEIDFVNGEVRYYELDLATGDVSGKPYQTYTFKQILEAAGKDTSGLSEKGTFADYSVHTFKFYYMERGSGSSVCRLNFNFPLLQKNSITVKKENASLNGGALDDTVLGNPDYYFNVMAEDGGENDGKLFIGPGSVTGITEYRIMDANGNILKNEDQTDKIFKVDEYGIFTLKAGQSAVFTGLPENEGEFYVQELIKAPDNEQYPYVSVNDQESGYNEIINWAVRKTGGTDTTGPYGYQWYGRNGPTVNISSNHSFFFKQQNRLKEENLGSLSITKKMEGESPGRAFTMEVTLDGEELPVGTSYTVGNEKKTVETAGQISLEPGQTAVISRIISGTVFEVRELDGSAYTVTYTAENADEMKTDGNRIQGVVRTKTNVQVTVTNTVQGASVEIPVTKRFVTDDAENVAHNYTFKLQQVTDQTGTTLVETGTELVLNASFTGNQYEGLFRLSYLRHELPELPVTFYYRISEEGVESDSLANNQQFVAEVLVSEKDGKLSAELTQMIGGENSQSAGFVNTLVGTLELTKNVVGSTEAQNQSFQFRVTLEKGSNLEALPEIWFTIGTVTRQLPTDGIISLKHGETAVLSGIPVGTKWHVSEIQGDGYRASVSVNGEIRETEDVCGTITLTPTEVTWTNTQMYTLPETGGNGTALYRLAGLTLCVGAWLLYTVNKHRKKVTPSE